MANKTCDMTTPVTIQNVNGWGVDLLTPFDEDADSVQVKVTFYGAGGVGSWATHIVTVSNTRSDKLSRNVTPSTYWDKLVFEGGALETPTGFSDLVTAYRGAANNKAARRKAIADTLLSLGVVDSSLGGTTA
jgi:hypothetical protein